MKSSQRQRGQVMPLFAISLIVILGAIGLAVDGGFGFYHMRTAQNAADFASEAAALALNGACYSPGSTVSQQQLYQVINDEVNANTSSQSLTWTAYYVGRSGSMLSGDPTLTSTANSTQLDASVPGSACGVKVVVNPRWDPFVEQLLGFATLGTSANATAISTPPIGIVALAPAGGHTIYGNGSGKFVIYGNIFDNSNNNADTTDEFTNAALKVYGTIQGASPNILDPCFTDPPAGSPPPSQSLVTAHCSQHTTEGISYYYIQNQMAQVTDPLAALQPPTQAATICSGAVVNTVANPPSSGNFYPGVYTAPVVVTGSATFNDCSGKPGVYDFEHGIEICPSASGDSVQADDVTFYAASTFGGSSTGCSGLATNVSWGMTVGGAAGSTVSFVAPTTGPYRGISLYQDRSTPANLGLDAASSDGATINITGLVYDNSAPNAPGGPNANGGLLQSGSGTNCGTSGPSGPSGPSSGPPPDPGGPGPGSGGPQTSCSSGSVTITGGAVVDDFSTEGETDLTIHGQSTGSLAILIS